MIMSHFVVVGLMPQVEHRVWAEAAKGLIDGCRKGPFTRRLGLIEPEDAQVCCWIVSAEPQQSAHKVVQGGCILPQAVSIIICRAKEPECCLVDALDLQLPVQL